MLVRNLNNIYSNLFPEIPFGTQFQTCGFVERKEKHIGQRKKMIEAAMEQFQEIQFESFFEAHI